MATRMVTGLGYVILGAALAISAGFLTGTFAPTSLPTILQYAGGGLLVLLGLGVLVKVPPLTSQRTVRIIGVLGFVVAVLGLLAQFLTT